MSTDRRAADPGDTTGHSHGRVPVELGHELRRAKELDAFTTRAEIRFLDGLRDMYATDYTYGAALLAAGGVVKAVRSVATGAYVNAFAVVRPPGHHCSSCQYAGFCFFNNVAVAARYAQRHLGVKRVCIIDWDVHHGDGTQQIFDEDPSVLFISLHRRTRNFYPASGHANEVGAGAGRGYSVNIPWLATGLGDHEFAAAFEYIVLPIVSEFNPDLILVSAGFDAAEGDPLGGMCVSSDMYAQLTSLICALRPPKGVVLALEGGYNLDSIKHAAVACMRSLVQAGISDESSLAAGDQLRTVSRALDYVGSDDPVDGGMARTSGGRKRLLPPEVPLPWFVHPAAIVAFQQVANIHAEFWESMRILRDSNVLQLGAQVAPVSASSSLTAKVQAAMNWLVSKQADSGRASGADGASPTPLSPVPRAEGFSASEPWVATLEDLMSPDGSGPRLSTRAAARRAPPVGTARVKRKALDVAYELGKPSATISIELAPGTAATTEELSAGEASGKSSIEPAASYIVVRDGLSRVLLRYEIAKVHEPAQSPAKSPGGTSSPVPRSNILLRLPVIVPGHGSMASTVDEIWLVDGTAVEVSGKTHFLMLPASTLPPGTTIVEEGKPILQAPLTSSASAASPRKLALTPTLHTVRASVMTEDAGGDAAATLPESLAQCPPACVAFTLMFQTATDVKALCKAAQAATGAIPKTHGSSTKPKPPVLGRHRKSSEHKVAAPAVLPVPAAAVAAIAVAAPALAPSGEPLGPSPLQEPVFTAAAIATPVPAHASSKILPGAEQGAVSTFQPSVRADAADEAGASPTPPGVDTDADLDAITARISSMALSGPASHPPASSVSANEENLYDSEEVAAAGPDAAHCFTLLPQTRHPLPENLSCLCHMVLLSFPKRDVSAPADLQSVVERAANLLAASTGPGGIPLSACAIRLPRCLPAWTLESMPGAALQATVSPVLLEREAFILTMRNERIPRQIASLTKCLTAIIVLGLCDALQSYAGDIPADDVLLEPKKGLHSGVVVTARASAVRGGTKAVLEPGERLTVWELLHGMMLPSGNDAATALAEAFGRFCRPEPEESWRPFERAPHYATADWGREEAVSRFVAEMNRTASALGMHGSIFANAHGMVHVRHHSSAIDVAHMAYAAMADPRFHTIVGSGRYQCAAMPPVPAGSPSAAGAAAVMEHPAVALPAVEPRPESPAQTESIELGGDAQIPTTTVPAVAAATSRPATARTISTRRTAARPAPEDALPKPRPIRWRNTNSLLGSSVAVRGFKIDGVKTGITPGAYGCLVLHAAGTVQPESLEDAGAAPRPAADVAGAEVELFGITLGSTNKVMRFIDNQRLLQWAAEALAIVGLKPVDA